MVLRQVDADWNPLPGTERSIQADCVCVNYGFKPSVEAAALMRDKAAWLFDAGKSCGAEANMAKLLSSQAAWAAANACLDAHGGYGFVKDYDVERKFRETRLYITAPVSNNMVLNFLGQNVLGMPRSY